MSICRFCAKHMPHYAGVQYGVRHYAHFACYLDHKPLSDLHTWQIEGFPYKLLRERDLMDEVERLTAEHPENAQTRRRFAGDPASREPVGGEG